MKKFIIIAALVITGCVAADPSNNVSYDSYRSGITQAQVNLENIRQLLIATKSVDRVHTAAWWDVKIDLVYNTMTLNSSTLAGSNIAPVKS